MSFYDMNINRSIARVGDRVFFVPIEIRENSKKTLHLQICILKYYYG
jgi:hypothetical protein